MIRTEITWGKASTATVEDGCVATALLGAVAAHVAFAFHKRFKKAICCRSFICHAIACMALW
jgi:hypothetical protein